MDEWLRSIGLAHRIPAFREQDISLDQISDLTDEDLRELGLTMGERRRFQREAASRRTRDPSPEAVLESGEHRIMTVLFADLVGSTELSETLDGEDLVDLIRDYREFCGEAIGRYGGYVARFIGDGVLAYFCYPVANENDPERAVRAAMEIVSGIGRLRTVAGRPLSARIGLATGRVIVGDLLAGGARDLDTVIGSLPNLASRLQALAGPNEIMISSRTHERVCDRFACEKLGPLQVRGFGEALTVWRVWAERATGQVRDSRDERLAGTPFVGREAQLEVLRLRWEEALSGRGSAVLVVGEAGIGKSRLASHFIRTHAAGASVVQISASPFDASSPLRPFVDDLVESAGIVAGDDRAGALGKLAAFVDPAGDKPGSVEVLARLLGLAGADATDRMRPEELRTITVRTAVEHLLARADRAPLCLMVEDVHWLDPTSGELLDTLLRSVADRSVLVVLTSRHVVDAPWRAHVHTCLELGRLTAAQVRQMMQGVFPDDLLPGVARLVSDRTDGIPLFVEEVARVLTHHGVALGLDVTPGFLIPASLEETLMARLDQAGPARDVVQAAAVIGRSARRDVLGQVCGLAPPELDAALGSLVALGILDPDGPPRSEVVRFHHALLRDAAYASLLRKTRRRLHERTARALQALDRDGVAHYPETLALHFSEAGQPDEAAELWLDAARRSLARSSLAEAVQLLRHALNDIERLPDTEATRNRKVATLALLGPALIGLKGAGAPETQDLYAQAYELCQNLPDDPGHFPIYWGWWRVSPFGTGRSERLLERARKWNDPDLLLEAHHCSWAVQFQRGAFHDCRSHIDAGLAIYEAGNYAHHAPLYGNHDAKICALGDLSQLYWMEGRLAQARRADRDALDWAESLDHLGSRFHAMGLTLLHSVYRRDLREVFDRSAALKSLASQTGMADQGAPADIFQGWVLALTGDFAEGLTRIEAGMARQRAIATNEDVSVYLCLLAEALIRAGRADEAVDRITRELPDLEASDLWIWLPELYRVLAEATHAAAPAKSDVVQRRLDEAAALADKQGVPMLGLRVALTRGRLLQAEDPLRAAALVRWSLGRISEQDGSADVAEALRIIVAAESVRLRR
jgi:predicted ATPase/class 3 adenylate cyclase